MIRKLLIANRGEIAVRVIRAAREMGIRTVAVYSDSDREAMHTAMADQSFYIGGSAPAESYLNSGAIISVALKCAAGAIHPGYGFLSERPEFSQACADAGIIFVGPSPSAMRSLGSKSAAKSIALDQSVPIVPGHFALGATLQDLKAAANQIGYPVMLKASAGGGGRGMRIVRDAALFEGELETASDEALKAFGDGSMMVEKLIERPRHVEVQVLADSHGSVACLFERECSLQRRHQKLVEEGPSPYLATNLKMWNEMQGCARRLVLATGYVGAGTVEFMVDEPNGNFYFLEVNTRIQVEHPVTEAITGIDLVRWQIKIANGESLGISDELLAGARSQIQGHSIEVRVVAEDPSAGFMPSTGRIVAWAEPKGPGIRVETGFSAGSEISRFYDSLVAKVISHGETRGEAIEKLRSALMDFHVLGIKTNIGFLVDLLAHPNFIAGQFDTGFLGREFGTWRQGDIPKELGSIDLFTNRSNQGGKTDKPKNSVWGTPDAYRNAYGS